MKDPDSSSEAASSILVEMLTPIVQEAVADAVNRLSEQIKTRPPRPFNVDEAAEYLSMPKGTLYQLTSKRMIPFHKRGKRLYFYQDDLDKWLKSEG